MTRTLILAVGAPFLFSAVAEAADLPYPPPIIEAPEVIPVPIKVGGGWYLRGHIGMSSQRLDKLDTPIFDNGTFTVLDKGGFDSGVFFGGGIGFKANEWVRFDVTGEYRGKTSFHALDTYEGMDGDFLFWGTNEYSATKSEWLGLVNAYVDLGNFHGLTPYVGAGLGLSRNTIDHYRDINVPNLGVAFAPRESKWNFAWALHAGLAYEVTPNLTLDLGYRYVDLGDAVTGPVFTYDDLVDRGDPMHFKGITSHDVMLGMRWNFGGHKKGYADDFAYYEPEPYFKSEPVVTKY